MGIESTTADVIVPCGHSAVELRRCLEALEKQDVEFEYKVCVVDSFRDAEVVSCANRFELVTVLRAGSARLTAGEARNLGAAASEARYLAFCDADCAPEPGWLAAAVKALDLGAVMVTGPISDLLKAPVAVADNMLQFVDFAKKRPRAVVAYAPGCNFALRRKDFLDSGGFPTGIGEDVLFSTSLASRHGETVLYEPEMKQRHAGRGTVSEMIDHHRAFGRARGELGLFLSRAHERFGSYRCMVPVFALRRLGYLVLRTMQYRPERLILVIVLLPYLLVGLLGWALGFRDGSLRRASARRS